jgi:ribonuclease Y
MASIFDRLTGTLEPKKPASRRRVAREKIVKARSRRAVAPSGEEERSQDEGRRQVVLLRRETEIDRKLGVLEERERQLKNREEELEKKFAEVEEIKKEQLARLERAAKLTRDEARTLILEATEKRLAGEEARRIREVEERIKAEADEKAQEILTDAMQHGVTDYVAEYTVSTVHLEDEEMKGRIIGREGRNIRAFEQATGVEIELDESNDIHLSSFDPVRREIARRALLRLIRDRRIQPSRIEELVQKTQQAIDKILFEEGQKLCHAVKVYNLHSDLVKLLGRFKFRFSYGQNMIAHTLEETKIGVTIALEIGANVTTVRLGCLLHDLGKVITEQEGTHVELGVNMAKKYNLPPAVIACIEEHHEDKPFSSPESRIIWIADAASGARPGARYEPHEEYVKRMTQIEKIAGDFSGVKKAYAYQAGRDVRVLVDPEEVSDDELIVLVNKITEKLEKEIQYAGQIKVTGIREMRVDKTTKAK